MFWWNWCYEWNSSQWTNVKRNIGQTINFETYANTSQSSQFQNYVKIRELHIMQNPALLLSKQIRGFSCQIWNDHIRSGINTFWMEKVPSSLKYKTHFSRQLNCWLLRCSCRRCSNYIFLLHLTIDFNILRKDNFKLRWEIFHFWDLVRLVSEILRYLWFQIWRSPAQVRHEQAQRAICFMLFTSWIVSKEYQIYIHLLLFFNN